MFTGFLGAMGTPEGELPVKEAEAESSASTTEGGQQSTFDIWSVASVISSTVKQRAGEFVKSVQETDWRAEISAFGTEVQKDTKTLSKNTAEFVEHLPEVVEHLPEKLPAAPRLLPSAEVGHTLEEVGTSITTFGKSLLLGTKELLEQVKDAMETEMSAVAREQRRTGRPGKSNTSKLASLPAKYSRFEAEVSAMQRDSSTYCDVPDDKEDYEVWRSTFLLEAVEPEIEKITKENAFMAELQNRIVPLIVERQDFWTRYFYRLHKLQLKEEQRQQLAQRAKTFHMEEEEELGWDDEEDEKEEEEDTGEEEVGSESELLAAEEVAHKGEADQIVMPRTTQPEPTSIENSGGHKDEVLSPPPSYEEAISGNYEQVEFNAESMLENKAESVSTADVQPLQVTPASGKVEEPKAPEEPHPAAANEVQSGSPYSAHGGSQDQQSLSSTEHVEAEHVEAEADGIATESASDGSGKGEWCVVSKNADAAGTEPTPAPEANPAPAKTSPAPSNSKKDESDVDEDWGNWD